MKGHAYPAQSPSMEEVDAAKQNFTRPEGLEEYFSGLSEITDRVAMINSEYQTDIASALDDLLNFISWDDFNQIDKMDQTGVQSFLSHMSFHREIIADIINEARQLLMEERRESLRRLVSYHKIFVKNFAALEKSLLS